MKIRRVVARILLYAIATLAIFQANQREATSVHASTTSSNLVQEVNYDAKDREVTFEFNKNVTYNDVTVVITNQNDTETFPATITERDNDELTVSVPNLTTGETYNYKITGVTPRRSNTSPTLTGTFTAVDID